MPDQRIIEQVNGILAMNNINFLTHENKRSFLVPSGSAGVYVDFVDWGDGTVVTLNSPVLEQVDALP